MDKLNLAFLRVFKEKKYWEFRVKTPEEYKESLKKMRPNIYKFGELIKDVTTHPATRRCIEGHAKIYEAAQNPEYKDIVVTTSHLTGEKISRY